VLSRRNPRVRCRDPGGETLFMHSFADTGVLPNFDVAPDGERILAFIPAARFEKQQTMNHVTVMLNFSGDVRRRTTSR
jgi:hypothetical protein